MAANNLGESHGTAVAGTQQEPRGSAKLQTAVDPSVLREVAEAFAEFGFASTSAGVKLVSLTFARSPEVRSLIRGHLHLAVLDAAPAIDGGITK